MSPERSSAAPEAGAYAYLRLAVSLTLMTIGGAGIYAVVVALKPMAEEFDASRSSISIAYAVTTAGFGLGGIMMGRWSDRVGVMIPAMTGSIALAVGFIMAGYAATLWQLYLAQGIFIGLLGNSAVFAPLVADTTHWFNRRRGMAVAIVISGNYLAGVVWPPIVQHFIDAAGWRQTFIGIGIFCLCAMLPLCLLLYRRAPHLADATRAASKFPARPLAMAPNALHCILCVAGIGCCVAMAVPQAHIVAHASDLGHPAARGAEMLALMLGAGVVSRLIFGAVSDRIGGLKTLLVGSALQALMLAIFAFAEGLTALYLTAILFGLSQGGIVPAYTIIIRTFFAPAEAGWRIGTTLFFTLFGMAIGGWIAGLFYDLTGSYQAAFANAVVFNILNTAIAAILYRRSRRISPAAALAATDTIQPRH